MVKVTSVQGHVVTQIGHVACEYYRCIDEKEVDEESTLDHSHGSSFPSSSAMSKNC